MFLMNALHIYNVKIKMWLIVTQVYSHHTTPANICVNSYYRTFHKYNIKTYLNSV